jgi:Holliday junction resolvasome RuvABC endonuclease subunit
MNIFALDIGYRNNGYSIYSLSESKIIACSELHNDSEQAEEVLLKTYDFFYTLFRKHKINIIVYEDPVFVNKGLVGQKINWVLGIILLLSGIFQLQIFKYNTKLVKKELTGDGNSKKEELALEVSKFFNIKNEFSSNHASDSLALIAVYIKKQNARTPN